MPDLLRVLDLRAWDDEADMLRGMEFEVGALAGAICARRG